MRWKVQKLIPLEQVQERLNNLQEKHGSLSLLTEEFAKGRMPPGKFEEYIEWTTLDHTIRAYNEGEDFEYFAEEELELTPEDYGKLTPRRLELLDLMTRGMARSINELADQAGRDVKNVYRDIKTLEELGFVSLTKEGRSLIPELLVYEITIILG